MSNKILKTDNNFHVGIDLAHGKDQTVCIEHPTRAAGFMNSSNGTTSRAKFRRFEKNELEVLAALNAYGSRKDSNTD